MRRQSFFGVMMTIVSSMLVARTERGDQMFLTMLDRHSSHVSTPVRSTSCPRPRIPKRRYRIRPTGRAPTGPEPLWNESWYWDFADPGQGVGGWIRLGLVPNQDLAWINALICGTGHADGRTAGLPRPFPDDPNDVHGDGIELRHAATVPLQEYRVEVRGPAQVYDDRRRSCAAGQPAGGLTMNLVWTTTGTPYAYRIATRYEIPCTISGTVTGDGRTMSSPPSPGSATTPTACATGGYDWVWSALHPTTAPICTGWICVYPECPRSASAIQPPGQPVIETTAVTADATLSEAGLPMTTTLTMEPGHSSPTSRSAAMPPVRLVAPTDRVSFFPRAWATVQTADGRHGVGWLEWNTNQRD